MPLVALLQAWVFRKPVAIVYEEEARFFPFDLERGWCDLCLKEPRPPKDSDGNSTAADAAEERAQGSRRAQGRAREGGEGTGGGWKCARRGG